jgi:hypothetical protein
MGYIIKDNEGLIVTRLTDTGRRKISQGNFNISYFQIGDSEVNYSSLSNYNYNNFMVLQPSYNAQNNAGIPQSNKNDVKYPYYLQNPNGITYGIPYEASTIDEVYNSAAPSGFFTADTVNSCYVPVPFSDLCYNSQYDVQIDSGTNFDGTSASITMALVSTSCPDYSNSTISANTIVAMYLIGDSSANLCGCLDSCYPIMFFEVVDYDSGTNEITVDRIPPNLTGVDSVGYTGRARLFFYPKNMSYYDLPTPTNYWSQSVINYESVCTPEDGLVKVWNMNIPWSENPAGNWFNNYTYDQYDSVNYIGTKEYYGYMNSSGQTDTSGTWYYNSFGEQINVSPEDQKVIAIVHYTNNAIINFYGEKFSVEVYDSSNPGDTGQARNFKITIPWIMWHKNSNCCNGLTLYIDPPGFEDFDLLTPYYIESSKNADMNNPGLRYYHLYDTNATPNGRPNRVGKVFPDDKVIVFDDEEIVAAMTYVSNRNYTLPAPSLDLIASSTFGGGTEAILNNDQECLWITYGFEGPWQGMHCNYYQKIVGPTTGCTITSQNVVVKFGGDFSCMNDGSVEGYWNAYRFFVLAQKTSVSTPRPEADKWVKIDFTQTIVDAGYGGDTTFIDPTAMTNVSFIVSQTNYDTYEAFGYYNINNQIQLPPNIASNDPNYPTINFGSEYFFYGTIETDIEATIYEMRYLINLPNNQFIKSSNPTWSDTQIPYMSEIGLYDSDKNLMVLSKFQSPQIRQGIQQIVVKLDF